MAQRRVLTRQQESALLRAERARECAAQAAAMKEQIAESFVAEQPGKTVLLRLAFSLLQA